MRREYQLKRTGLEEIQTHPSQVMVHHVAKAVFLCIQHIGTWDRMNELDKIVRNLVLLDV